MSEFTTNELAYQLEIKKLREELQELKDNPVRQTSQLEEKLQNSLILRTDELLKLREEMKELKENPVRQTSQLEEAILLIPAIQSLLTGLTGERAFSYIAVQRLREMIKDEIENAIDLQAEDFEEEVKKVVRDMTFELSSTEVEVY